MKPIIIGIAAAAMASVTSPAVFAQDVQASGVFKDTDVIYDLCRSPDSANVTLCEHYLMAVYDTISYFTDLDQIEKAICVGTGTKAAALREAFVAYVDAKPDRRKYSAVSIGYNAFFGAAFNACAKK